MKKTALLTAVFMIAALICCTALASASHLPYTQETMPAPEVCSLVMLEEEFEENPVLQFSLKIPAQLEEDIAAIEALGGSVTVRTEARIQGEEEWEVLWTNQNGAHAGDIRGYVVSIAEDGEIIPRSTMLELRCCYCVEQYDPDTHEYIEEFDSAYSGIYRVNEDTGIEPAPTAEPTETQEPEHAPPKKAAGKFLVYFLIALAEAALVAGIVIVAKKKKNK